MIELDFGVKIELLGGLLQVGEDLWLLGVELRPARVGVEEELHHI